MGPETKTYMGKEGTALRNHMRQTKLGEMMNYRLKKTLGELSPRTFYMGECLKHLESLD